MHNYIRHDLDSAPELMVMRTQLAALEAEWKAAGTETLPAIQERFKATNRLTQMPKPVAYR